METLIQQIAALTEPETTANETISTAKALKEVLLRAFDRWGVMKKCAWLPELDQFNDSAASLSFICQDDEPFDCRQYAKYIQDELNSYGLNDTLQPHENLFEINIASDVKLFVFFFNYSYDLRPVVAYQQAPLAYEYYSVSNLPETVLAEISSARDAAVKAVNEPQKPAKQAKSRKKAAQKKDEFIQPSLFDF